MNPNPASLKCHTTRYHNVDRDCRKMTSMNQTFGWIDGGTLTDANLHVQAI